jgi:hypothetical protein
LARRLHIRPACGLFSKGADRATACIIEEFAMSVSSRFLALIAAVAMTATTFVLPAYVGPAPVLQNSVTNSGH